MDEERRWREEIELAIKKIAGVAEQRNDEDALTRCMTLSRLLVRTTAAQRSPSIRRENRSLKERIEFELVRIAEDLSMVINLELREIVFPLQDLKESTHRFGVLFSPSKYLTWMSEDRPLSPEEAIGYLERQLDNLDFALDLFRKQKKRKAPSPYA
jgi:hypothetical protein